MRIRVRIPQVLTIIGLVALGACVEIELIAELAA